MTTRDPKMSIRITKIEDTRTWWQKSTLSRMPWRLVLAMTIYGAVVGGLLGGLK